MLEFRSGNGDAAFDWNDCIGRFARLTRPIDDGATAQALPREAAFYSTINLSWEQAWDLALHSKADVSA